MKAAFLATVIGLACLADAAPNFRTEAERLPAAFESLQKDDYGQFSSSFLTKGGLRVEQQGVLKPIVVDNETKYVLVQKGKYGYEGYDGVPVNLEWSADENGFHPVGSHLPVAPAVPEPVQ